MRILHTSDWHLGQKLFNQDRQAEHELALDWLLDLIRQEAVDCLLVAGDIFDIANPPNQARELYYDFLRKLRDTPCRHVVITGGNHDSPSMLNAPKELLRMLQIQIVGAATDPITEELIELRNSSGELEAVVAAVPFLRDRDLRYHQIGTSFQERQQQLQQGLQAHYQRLATEMEQRNYGTIPMIAMGHLYASGAESAARQDNIYLGSRENMRADQFPDTYDYVALGHIHRAQAIGAQAHIRYSGSLIPLDLSETSDEKSVCLLEFVGKTIQGVRLLPVPTFRRLKRIRGPLEKVEATLERFLAKEREGLPPWLELMVETDRPLPGLVDQLQQRIAPTRAHLLAIRLTRTDGTPSLPVSQVPSLDSLDVETVFRQRCSGGGQLPKEEWEPLLQTFRELREWMDNQKEEQLNKG